MVSRLDKLKNVENTYLSNFSGTWWTRCLARDLGNFDYRTEKLMGEKA